MNTPQSPLGEVAELGNRIYIDRLRDILEPTHNGKYVVIDVDSGDYEVDAVHIAAFDRIMARHPSARLYATRAGFKVFAHIGGRLTVARQA